MTDEYIGLTKDKDIEVLQLDDEGVERVEIYEKPSELKPIDVEDVQICFVGVFGRSGSGKTLYAVGETFSALLYSDADLLITNVSITKLPEYLEQKRCEGRFEIFQSGDIRKILEKMIASKGKKTVIFFDELGKSVSSLSSHQNFVIWVTEITSSARKYDVGFFIWTDQYRKASSNRIRANMSVTLKPVHLTNRLGQPLAYSWRDGEEFEVDFAKGEGNYEYGFHLSSNWELSFLRSAYNTREIIALNMIPTISEEDAPILTQNFLQWCQVKGIDLRGESERNVFAYLNRWNTASFVIPYPVKGLKEVLWTELLRLRVLDEPEEEDESIGEKD